MRIYLRGKVYWFGLEFNGQEIRRSTKSKNKRLAEQIASAFHTSLIKGEVGIVERKPAPTLEKAMKSFLEWSRREHAAHPATWRKSKGCSKALLAFFGKGRPIDTVTPGDVERFKAARSEDFTTKKAGKGRVKTDKVVRPATVNREMACLREMFNHSLKQQSHLRNPVSAVRFLNEDNQQERVITFAEQRAYLAAATPILRDVAGLILETGMRPEEVYKLQGTAIDLEQGFLRILKGKTPAAKRRIELTAESRRILAERAKLYDAGWLFPLKGDTKRHIPKVANAHDRAIILAKLPKFRLYDLRHTWATRAAEAGVDLVTLAAMMGHARIQMVMRYAHPTQKHQTSAMEMLSEHNRAKEAREKAAESGLQVVSRKHA